VQSNFALKNESNSASALFPSEKQVDFLSSCEKKAVYFIVYIALNAFNTSTENLKINAVLYT
jgi:hypothetical protein